MLNRENKVTNTQFLVNYASLFIIIFLLVSMWFWQADHNVMPKINMYLQILTFCVFFVTGIVTIQTFKFNLEDRDRNIALQYSNTNNAKLNDIDKMFMASPILNRLYNELYPENDDAEVSNDNVKEMIKAEQIACTFIFRFMSDIYVTEDLDRYKYDHVVWIKLFKKWMKSPILKIYWLKKRNSFHKEFIIYVENNLLK